jgi:hypothetical protein
MDVEQIQLFIEAINRQNYVDKEPSLKDKKPSDLIKRFGKKVDGVITY